LSAQGEKVIISAMGIGLLSLLVLGFVILAAPVPARFVPVILLWVAAVRGDVLHVRKHGWGIRGSDGPDGDGGRHPSEPTPPAPSGDGEQFDWDAFVTQFWEHVDRAPVR